MFNVLSAFFAVLSSVFCNHVALQVEILALRHQIGVLQRSARKRPKLSAADRFLWAWLSGVWSDWRSVLVIVKPECVNRKPHRCSKYVNKLRVSGGARGILASAPDAIS